MADYTNYNQGSTSKGPIVAVIVLAALIIGLLFLAANAPTAPDGSVTGEPATAVETAPLATESTVPAPVTD